MASAQRELQEMQTLLSTFGPIVEQDTTTTERTDLCTTTVEQNAPRDGDDGYLNAEFESALTELYNIEGDGMLSALVYYYNVLRVHNGQTNMTEDLSYHVHTILYKLHFQ